MWPPSSLCGSAVWALPIQGPGPGARLSPSQRFQLESVSKTAGGAESIDGEDKRAPAGGQRPPGERGTCEEDEDAERERESVTV